MTYTDGRGRRWQCAHWWPVDGYGPCLYCALGVPVDDFWEMVRLARSACRTPPPFVPWWPSTVELDDADVDDIEPESEP